MRCWIAELCTDGQADWNLPIWVLFFLETFSGNIKNAKSIYHVAFDGVRTWKWTMMITNIFALLLITCFHCFWVAWIFFSIPSSVNIVAVRSFMRFLIIRLAYATIHSRKSQSASRQQFYNVWLCKLEYPFFKSSIMWFTNGGGVVNEYMAVTQYFVLPRIQSTKCHQVQRKHCRISLSVLLNFEPGLYDAVLANKWNLTHQHNFLSLVNSTLKCSRGVCTLFLKGNNLVEFTNSVLFHELKQYQTISCQF